MIQNSPDLITYKTNLDSCIAAIRRHKLDSSPAIKVLSLLNVTVYVLATRFIEASVKHIIHNCCIMRGDSQQQLEDLITSLKSFNNPEYGNIVRMFNDKLNFNINEGLSSRKFEQSDITFLNEVVNNRHRNVHANSDATTWYNSNQKDIEDFLREYPSIVKIIGYLDSIEFNRDTGTFLVQ
ncbi:hypothetical protein M5X11_29700 [Paenibacillus alginolyticus]|uniref:hypothetical protein n=1 Tax=Paenibacillus alginolyticus TaxID=59839 RepID=UPI000492ABA4|nr:hypothetical protein [Paenibacillus alginolyticus]MCY9669052.1 hypothetical protein [Paenibacillus alginolyticus]